jgi:hypothetical protein
MHRNNLLYKGTRHLNRHPVTKECVSSDMALMLTEMS